MFSQLFRFLFFKDFEKYHEYQKEVYYYSLYSQYDFLENILNHRINFKKRINVDKKINFAMGIEFGMSIKQMRRKFKKPIYYYDNPIIKNHKILFYLKKIYKFEIVLELHFLNNNFFLGVYNFSNNPNSQDFHYILSLICSKYNLDYSFFNPDKHVICGNNNILIDIEFNTKILVAYLDSNNTDILYFKSRVLRHKEALEKRRFIEQAKLKEFL